MISFFSSAFYKLTNEIPKESREFSIAVTSIADSLGITLAGFTGKCLFRVIFLFVSLLIYFQSS